MWTRRAPPPSQPLKLATLTWWLVKLAGTRCTCVPGRCRRRNPEASTQLLSPAAEAAAAGPQGPQGAGGAPRGGAVRGGGGEGGKSRWQGCGRPEGGELGGFARGAAGEQRASQRGDRADKLRLLSPAITQGTARRPPPQPRPPPARWLPRPPRRPRLPRTHGLSRVRPRAYMHIHHP